MKRSVIGIAALCASLVACPDPKPAAPTPLEIVKTALERLGKAAHYRIDATLTGGGETRQYTLDYVAPDRTHYRSAQAEAITIGATYYDRFMGGPWNVSSTGSGALPSAPDTVESSEIANVLPFGKGKLNAKSCDIYLVVVKASSVDAQFCVDPVSGLPLIIELDDPAQGNLVQKFDYDVTLTITAPV